MTIENENLKETAIRQHREMWRWIAHYYHDEKNPFCNIDTLKEFYITAKGENEESNDFPNKSHYFCFLCKFADTLMKQKEELGIRCIYCPLQWIDDTTCPPEILLLCTDNGSPYIKIKRSRIPSERLNRETIAKLAMQIAELPEKVMNPVIATTDIYFLDGQYIVDTENYTIEKCKESLTELTFQCQLNRDEPIWKALMKLIPKNRIKTRIIAKRGNLYNFQNDERGYIYIKYVSKTNIMLDSDYPKYANANKTVLL